MNPPDSKTSQSAYWARRNAEAAQNFMPLQDLIEIVSAQTSVPVESIIGSRRFAKFAKARSIIYQFARDAGYSTPVIADVFNRDHSTILVAIRRGRCLIDHSAEYRKTIIKVGAAINERRGYPGVKMIAYMAEKIGLRGGWRER